MPVTDRLQLARKAAQDAVDVLRSVVDQPGVVSSEQKDIKTEADRRANQVISEQLSHSDCTIISEESPLPDFNKWELGDYWIVDPLDGTLNYVREFPIAAVSIAYWSEGQPVVGVVRSVFGDDEYYGIVGDSAWHNDRQMTVSTISDTSEAVIATGFPSGRKYDDASLLATVQKIQQYKKVRMLGCASFMLAHVADGRFDVYDEEDIYLWDIAAGAALVRAAGGNIRMDCGTDPWKFTVKATNGNL